MPDVNSILKPNFKKKLYTIVFYLNRFVSIHISFIKSILTAAILISIITLTNNIYGL